VRGRGIDFIEGFGVLAFLSRLSINAEERMAIKFDVLEEKHMSDFFKTKKEWDNFANAN
jgi:hypothetical protein